MSTHALRVALVLVLVGCGAPPAPPADAGAGPDGAVPCASALDCDDGVYCNGVEVCDPGAAGADDRGCARGAPICPGACDEATDSCGACRDDRDADGVRSSACGGADCDDDDPERRPGATEVCDVAGRDEDCDPRTFGVRDLDGDHIADAACCNADPEGGPDVCGLDCDDTRADVHTGATETCDGTDQDCDGAIDERVLVMLYPDADGDLFGDASSSPVVGCAATEGFAPNNEDCDDGDPAIRPGAPERCNGEDDDCDGTIDEDSLTTYFPDDDADGHGDPYGAPLSACTPPEGYAAEPDDCDDADAMVHPGATEACNGRDDNCTAGPDEAGCGTCRRLVRDTGTEYRYYLHCPSTDTVPNHGDARTQCATMGATLPIVDEPGEAEFLRVQVDFIGAFWLGIAQPHTRDATHYWQASYDAGFSRVVSTTDPAWMPGQPTPPTSPDPSGIQMTCGAQFSPGWALRWCFEAGVTTTRVCEIPRGPALP